MSHFHLSFYIALMLLSVSTWANPAQRILQLEIEIEQLLKDPNGEQQYTAKLAEWTPLIEQIKSNPDLLNGEIQSIRRQIEANLQAQKDEAQFRLLLDNWSRLNALQSRLGLTILKISGNIAKKNPEVRKEEWTDLRQRVAAANRTHEAEMQMMYKGNTGTEILESAKAFALEYPALHTAMSQATAGVLNGKVDRELFMLSQSGRSQLDLMVGVVNASGMLRTHEDQGKLEKSVEQIFFSSGTKANTAEFKAQELKLSLVPVLWMAEAIDVAQLTKDPAEASLRLMFDFKLRELTNKVISLSSYASLSKQQEFAASVIMLVKKALRTPENQMYLAQSLRQIEKTILPNAYSAEKAKLPLSKSWTFYMDPIRVAKEFLVTKVKAHALAGIADKVLCDIQLSPPEIRGQRENE